MKTERQPDDFLQSSNHIDNIFAELDIPIAVSLGERVIQRHLQVVPGTKPEARTSEQQAIDTFGPTIFPSPFKPAS
jgi:hypothetical protein